MLIFKFFYYFFYTCCCLVTKLCLTLHNPMDCCPPGSSVHGISQARILEWVAICFSGDLPDPEAEPPSLVFPALAGRFFTTEPPGTPWNSYKLLVGVYCNSKGQFCKIYKKFHVYIFYLVIPLFGTCPERKLDNMPNVEKEYSLELCLQ